MMDGGRKNRKRMTMVRFSDDIVTEILLRLPVKSLLTFKTVCKSWYSIINSNVFIREHLKRAHAARYNQHKCFLGILDNVLFKEDSDGAMVAKKFDFPTEILVGLEEEIYPWAHNSCDGLICFQNEDANTVLIWNPSLPTEYKIIDSFITGCCGMGYDPCTDDYKIISVPYCSVGANISVELFSLKRDSLRTIQITQTMNYQIENTKMIYTKNRLHWLGKGHHYTENEYEDGDESEDVKLFIGYFDLVEESLDYLNLPSSSDRHVVPLNYKESLGILCHNHESEEEEFWVLQDYRGMKSSWSKIFKIPYIHGPPWDYCFTSKGEFLLCGEMGLAIVDLKDDIVKDFEYEGHEIEDLLNCFFTSPYVESLISPRRLQ